MVGGGGGGGVQLRDITGGGGGGGGASASVYNIQKFVNIGTSGCSMGGFQTIF